MNGLKPLALRAVTVRMASTKTAPKKYVTIEGEELANKMKSLKDANWELSKDELFINKVYRFGGFNDAWAFLTQVALYSNARGHHPKIVNDYDAVTLTMHTHDTKSLTTLDLSMAAMFDKLGKTYKQYP